MAPPVVYTPEPNTVFQTVENTVVSNSIVIRTTAVIKTQVVRRRQAFNATHADDHADHTRTCNTNTGFLRPSTQPNQDAP